MKALGNKMAAMAMAVVVSSLAAAGPAQYKKGNRDCIAQVEDGNWRDAEAWFNAYLSEHPGDLEALYGRTVTRCQAKDLDGALHMAEEALRHGLPVSRFLAGPRPFLAPLVETSGFQALVEGRNVRLLHGPLVGCLTDRSASIWVRTRDEMKVRVRFGTTPDLSKDRRSRRVKTRAEADFTARVPLKRLAANERYYYRIELDGDSVGKTWTFQTAPAAEDPCAFTVGFGGGAGYTPPHERMWNTLAGRDPLAFLFLGDNVYIDHPKHPQVQRYCYYRRQSRPAYKRFVSGRAIFAIWDDHDFTTNDAGGGPLVDSPPWKRPVWRIFKENWNNPAYGGGEDRPGCWFSTAIGDVDFFFLDGRYYRTSPVVKDPTMLGPEQKAWLFDAVSASDATFKVIASPVPWAPGAKPGSRDPWDGYPEERREIFSFLHREGVNGVILLSADRHRSDVWLLEREAGYPLYEFESSRLTNIHTHGAMKGCLFSYNQKPSFGLLHFDTTLPDPAVVYEIVNIDDETIHTVRVKRSQLEG